MKSITILIKKSSETKVLKTVISEILILTVFKENLKP